MLVFVFPTLDKSLTWLSLILCALIILSERDLRMGWLVFIAGSGLGYFLERWGTTRECWTYYTYQTPPFFAVLAHGMAAVVFWRVGRLIRKDLEFQDINRLQVFRPPSLTFTLLVLLLRSLARPAYSALRVPLHQDAWRASTAPGFPMAAGFPTAARRGCGCAFASAGA